MSREAEAAANILFHRCGPATFDVAVVTGTGLSALADAVEQHMDMAKLAEWLPMLKNKAKETKK